jgi:formate hydrogenlyase subunit 4
MFVAVAVVRSAVARFRVNQASAFYQVAVTLVSVIGLLSHLGRLRAVSE